MPNLGDETLNGMTDDQLADLAGNLPAQDDSNRNGAGASSPYAEMSRDDLLKKCADAGIDPDTLKDKSDDDLKQMAEDMDANEPPDQFAVGDGSENQQGQYAAMWNKDPSYKGNGSKKSRKARMNHQKKARKHAEGDDSGDDDSGGDDAPDRQDMIDQLTELGEDPSTLQAMSDEDLSDLLDSYDDEDEDDSDDDTMSHADADPYANIDANNPKGGEPMPPPKPPAPKKVVTQTTQHFSEAVRKEVARHLQARNAEMSTITRIALTQKAKAKRATIDTFCESMVKQGKLLPAELNAVKLRLGRADASRIVRKFSDKGKTIERTELEEQMAEIEARPKLVTFGEKVKSQGQKSLDDEEIQKVKDFAELHEDSLTKFSEDAPKKLVENFKKMRAKNPRYTAQMYIDSIGNK